VGPKSRLERAFREPLQFFASLPIGFVVPSDRRQSAEYIKKQKTQKKSKPAHEYISREQLSWIRPSPCNLFKFFRLKGETER